MPWTDFAGLSLTDMLTGAEDALNSIVEHPWYTTTGAMVGSLLALRMYCRYTVGICRCATDLTGKIAVITGGNAGIGKATATELAMRNATVIIGCRNTSRGEQAVKDIKDVSGNQKVTFRLLDLCSFSSVRSFSESIKKNEGSLHILVNNAGVTGSGGRRIITQDGCEHIMQANYFGHFLLTMSLIDILKASAHSRIINVSSLSYKWGKLDLDDLDSKKKFDETDIYNKSKLAILLFTKALSKRLDGTDHCTHHLLVCQGITCSQASPLKRVPSCRPLFQGVTVNALNPGVVKTDIARNTPLIHSLASRFLFNLIGKTPLEGAQTVIHLAMSPELETVNGEYYSDCKKEKLEKAALDEEMAEKLFNISEDVVGLKMKPQD